MEWFTMKNIFMIVYIFSYISCNHGIDKQRTILEYTELKENGSECNCGENSVDCKLDVDGNRICTCTENYAQNNKGICEECNCGEHAVNCKFSEYGSKICTCKEDYQQNYYEGLCVECKCKNGYCVKRGRDYVCTCHTEYGKWSSTECRACNCGSYSNCTFSTLFRQKTCICRPGYKERNNVCIETCNQNTECLKNGRCTIDGGFCKCNEGVSGDKCDILDDCTSGGKYKDCISGGGNCTYDAKNSEVICICSGQKKWNAVQKLCQICDCGANMMNCEFSSTGDKKCECKDGFEQDGNKCRETCSQDADCGFKGNCSIERKFCECGAGLSGDKCDIIDDCGTNGTYEECFGRAHCTYNAKEEKAECVCPGKERWNPIKNKCELCDCGAEMTHCKFTSTGSMICECDDGFDIKDNKCTETCRMDRDCGLKGTCSIEGKFCKCGAGLSGVKCDIIDDCEMYGRYRDCTGWAKCIYNTTKEAAECICPRKEKWNPRKNRCEICDCGAKMVDCEFTSAGTMKCEYEDGFIQKENRITGDKTLVTLVACFGSITVLSMFLILYLILRRTPLTV